MSASIGDLRGRIVMDAQGFRRGMSEARNELDRTGQSSKNLKRDFDAVQKASAIVGGTVLAAIGGSVKVAANFEQAMARVKAITGATDDQFGQLKDAARELGASTQFSASQAAEAMGFLGMAGFDVNQTLAAMPGVLDLAAASQESLGTSADIVSNILSGFGLKAEDTGAAVDILVKSMTTANTNLPQLGEAMKYVAPVAASLGIPIEEVAAAVGKMSDAGIQGSQAGTALRAMLLSLANPTGQTIKAMEKLGINVSDAEGKMKPLPQLIGDVGEKMEGMTDTQKTATAAQLVGTEAASGFLALLDIGEEKLQDYTAELKNSEGAAAKMAEVQNDTVNGAFKEFQSALEELGIKVGNEFLPVFRELIEIGTDAVRWITEFDGESAKAILTFAGVTAGIGLTITTLGKLTLALRTTMLAMGPGGWAVIGLSFLGGLLASVHEKASELSEVNLELADSMIESNDSIKKNAEAFETLQRKSGLTSDEFGRFMDIQKELNKAVEDSEIEKLTAEQEALIEKSGLSNDELSRMVGLNNDLIDAVPEATGHITDQGNRVIDTTGAIHDYNDALSDATLRELDRQRIIAEGNEVEIKEQLKELQADLLAGQEREKELREEFKNFDEEATLARLEQLKYDLEHGDHTAREAQALRGKIELEEEKLTLNRDQLVKQMEINDEKNAAIEKLEAELGLVGEIDRRMIDVHLAHVGINAEKGKELEAIDTAIGKLQGQKDKLDELYPANMRNTDEYQNQVTSINEQIGGLETARDKVIGVYAGSQDLSGELDRQIVAINEKIGGLREERSELEKNTPAADRNTEKYRQGVQAIDDQIAELKGVRDQIGSIISAAGTMNSELGRNISKTVTIRTVGGTARDKGGQSLKRMPDLDYHSGGIVGQKSLRLPKYHTGGIAGLAPANPIGQDTEESRIIAVKAIAMIKELSEMEVHEI